jgi:pseudouridine synthase
MRERLQKILARAGYGSRRSAEALVASGRVNVNGVAVTRLGTQADIDADRIEVDGTPLRLAAPGVYLALNKPAGFLTAARDPRGRQTVMALLPRGLPPHVLPVGRLDQDTEGLLLFTDDGDLAHRLTHPRFRVDKEYLAHVRDEPSPDAIAALRAGVEIEGRRTSPAEADIVAPPSGYDARQGQVWLRLVIHEGRKRQVRRMCSAVGHPVRALIRTRIDGVALARLAKAKTRPLSSHEIASLRRAVGLERG